MPPRNRLSPSLALQYDPLALMVKLENNRVLEMVVTEEKTMTMMTIDDVAAATAAAATAATDDDDGGDDDGVNRADIERHFPPSAYGNINTVIRIN